MKQTWLKSDNTSLLRRGCGVGPQVRHSAYGVVRVTEYVPKSGAAWVQAPGSLQPGHFRCIGFQRHAFAAYQGFNAGDQFFNYLKDSFDTLYEEGAETPRMLLWLPKTRSA